MVSRTNHRGALHAQGARPGERWTVLIAPAFGNGRLGAFEGLG